MQFSSLTFLSTVMSMRKQVKFYLIKVEWIWKLIWIYQIQISNLVFASTTKLWFWIYHLKIYMHTVCHLITYVFSFFNTVCFYASEYSGDFFSCKYNVTGNKHYRVWIKFDTATWWTINEESIRANGSFTVLTRLSITSYSTTAGTNQWHFYTRSNISLMLYKRSTQVYETYWQLKKYNRHFTIFSMTNQRVLLFTLWSFVTDTAVVFSFQCRCCLNRN